MKHLFIINPASGKGKSIELIEKIKDKFHNSNEEYIIEITKYPEHAREIVREYVKNQCYRVYAVGGDGTLNEVLNGIVGSNSSLGVIPVGSGNDFARTVYKSYDFDDILQGLISGKEKIIDIGKVNDRFFLNVSSVGIDAEVAKNAIKFKRMPMISGSFAYLLSIFMTLINYASCIMKISVDDKVIHEEILLAAVGNGVFYGGGMKVLPKASITDAVFDLCDCQHNLLNYHFYLSPCDKV